MLEQRLQGSHDRAFTLGAGYVHRGKRVVRVSQFSSQLRQPLQVEVLPVVAEISLLFIVGGAGHVAQEVLERLDHFSDSHRI